MYEFLDTLRSITCLNPAYGMTYKHLIMIAISLGLMYLAIAQKKEPFLLLPLAFGILLANMPGANLSAYFDHYLLQEYFSQDTFYKGTQFLKGDLNPYYDPSQGGGLLYFIYKGIRPGGVGMPSAIPLLPPLIFLCLGAMSDFGPLISNWRVAIIGLGGQLGIFVAFGLYLLAIKFVLPLVGVLPEPGDSMLWGFSRMSLKEAACVGIIGSSDGPTSIYVAAKLGPHMLAAVAIAAFSYMGLVPFIQPPIIKLLVRSQKERTCVMPEPRQASQRTKILFPIAMTVVTLLLVPTAGALIGMLMMGNLIRECGIVERYVDTLSNTAMNFMTLMLAFAIGSSATAEYFLKPETLIILILGLVAFASGTVGGVCAAKILFYTTKGKISPLIGNSGVSAMPMAARISQRLGQEYNHQNHLLMHAMGPIVASTIGSAIVAGIFISLLTK